MINLIKHIFVKFLIHRASDYTLPDIYRKYYGVVIGQNCRFTGKNIVFGSEPYLIEIGNGVTITGGVIIETHDGGVGVFRQEHPGLNLFGRVKIGNNVFIGNRVIIMPGVTIGDNVVIGAGAIVTKNIPSNSVAAGIPAKVIKSIDDYKAKALDKGMRVLESDKTGRQKAIIQFLDSKINGQ